PSHVSREPARSPTNTPTSSTSADKAPAATPFTTDDGHAAYDHFKPLVAGHGRDDLEPWNADPAIVRVNLQRGVDAIRPHLAALREQYPAARIDAVLELPALGLGLEFADGKVFVPASAGEIKTRQARLRPVRRRTLLQLEILAEEGVIPADPVRQIRHGR